MPGLTVRVFLQVHVVVCMYVIFKRVKSHDFIYGAVKIDKMKKACTCRIVILGKHPFLNSKRRTKTRMRCMQFLL